MNLQVKDNDDHCIQIVTTHLVVCGCVEYEAKRTNIPDQLRVDPELEEEDKLRMNQEL